MAHSGDETTLTLSAEAPALAEAIPTYLRVVHPPALQGWIPLGATGGVLGRSDGGPEALPAIASGRVSRAHAEIQWHREVQRLSVRDLDSRNGSWLNGEALGATPQWLDPGATLRLGDVILVCDQDLGLSLSAEDVDESIAPGASGVMRRLRAQIARLAPDPAPILVIGETGTGKEQICRALHTLSGRRGPLITENCATVEANIAESRLFGHKRGAFTGASADHRGLLQQAHRGTLYLDEIGELPLDVQPKLLRALEQGEITPLGAAGTQQVDVRVVAATHRALEEMVQAGTFRQDLRARLNIGQLQVPPLRDRRGDILDWTHRLHQGWATARGLGRVDPLIWTEEAAYALVNHPWPDNLRGLKRVVHRLLITEGALATAAPISLATLKPHLEAAPSPTGPTPAATPAPAAPSGPKPPKPDAEALADALSRFGSVRATAKHFERDRRQIYRWIKEYDLTAPGGD